MSVLIIYATIEGQTGKIARFAEQIARDAGIPVAMFDAAEEMAQFSLEGVDKIILAAPVHERRHPAAFEVVVAASRDDLQARKTLMLSVSLSAAFPDGLPEAREYLDEMEMRTRFKPDEEALVAGAIRSARYGFFERQVIRHVVLRGRNLGNGDGPHEFTNWDSLERKLKAFLEIQDEKLTA